MVTIAAMALFTSGEATIGFALLLFVWVARLLSGRPPLWRRSVLDAPLAAFVIALVLSTVVSTDQATAVASTISTIIITGVLFGSFTWLLGCDPGIKATLLRVWALGGPPMAIVAIVLAWRMHDRASLPWMAGGADTFGTTLSLANLVALGLAFEAAGRARVLWFSCAFVTLMALIMNESRSALLGWVAGGLYLGWRQFGHNPRQVAIVSAGVLAVLAISVCTMPSFVSRVERFSTDFVGDRLQIWRVAAGIVKTRQLLGDGPGSFPASFGRQKPAGVERKWSAHNLWLHVAAETGLVGLATVLWIIFAAVHAWTKSVRLTPLDQSSLRPTVTAVGIAVLVNQCGDNTLLTMTTITGAWLILAWLVTPPSHLLEAGRELE
jgi:O-antigen ligase